MVTYMIDHLDKRRVFLVFGGSILYWVVIVLLVRSFISSIINDINLIDKILKIEFLSPFIAMHLIEMSLYFVFGFGVYLLFRRNWFYSVIIVFLIEVLFLFAVFDVPSMASILYGGWLNVVFSYGLVPGFIIFGAYAGQLSQKFIAWFRRWKSGAHGPIEK